MKEATNRGFLNTTVVIGTWGRCFKRSNQTQTGWAVWCSGNKILASGSDICWMIGYLDWDISRFYLVTTWELWDSILKRVNFVSFQILSWYSRLCSHIVRRYITSAAETSSLSTFKAHSTLTHAVTAAQDVDDIQVTATPCVDAKCHM
jgi:hypothetical protein